MSVAALPEISREYKKNPVLQFNIQLVTPTSSTYIFDVKVAHIFHVDVVFYTLQPTDKLSHQPKA